MKKKKKTLHKQKASPGLTVYNPECVSYQKLHLCKYLLELEELNPYRNTIQERMEEHEKTKGS